MSNQDKRPRIRRGTWLVLAGLTVVCCSPGKASAQSGWNPFGDQQGVTPPPARRPARPPAGETPRVLAPMEEAPSWSQPRPGEGADPRSARPGDQQVGGLPDGPAGPMPSRGAVELTDLPPLPPDGPAVQAAATPNPQANPQLGARLGSVPGTSLAPNVEWTRLSKEILVPVRSPALLHMLLRLADDAGGPPTAAQAIVPRAALLYRAGRTGEADSGVARVALGRSEPVISALGMRLALAGGDRERACQHALAVVQVGSALPASVRGEAIAVQGYCGAASGNLPAAGLAAQLAREQGNVAAETLALLEAVSAGDTAGLTNAGRISVLDWRLVELAGKTHGSPPPLDKLEAATLRAMALGAVEGGALRVGAAEAAARINAIDPAELGEAYRLQTFTAADLAQGQAAKVDPALRRALLFRAADAERTPLKRTRLVRAAMDDARRVHLYRPVAASLVRIVEDIRPVPEVGWFAETAVEVMLLAGRLDLARRWIDTLSDSKGDTNGGGERPGLQALSHWLALIDIADPRQSPQRGASLVSVEELALRGRFSPEGLHRLATVLDALDYHVPVKLWEAASRAPQPTTGFLPATGVLPELQAAARKRDVAETIVLAFKALGPDGPEGAHMIALGDVIRALKRAGLEPDARAIAVEALFGLWPRATGG
jgi:hypothetical protein